MEGELLFKDEVYQIVGAAFEVMKELGHGLREKTYERSMLVEFGLKGIPWEQQRRFEVLYKGAFVDEFIPDLIAYGAIVVEAKVIERITEHERGQLLNYLRITGLPVGLIINFKHPRIQWERMVLTEKRNNQGNPSDASL